MYKTSKERVRCKRNIFFEGGFRMNRTLDYVALAITIIGAINWGLIGFLEFDLVAWLFGNLTWISRIVYALVGICGLYCLTFYGRITDGN